MIWYSYPYPIQRQKLYRLNRIGRGAERCSCQQQMWKRSLNRSDTIRISEFRRMTILFIFTAWLSYEKNRPRLGSLRWPVVSHLRCITAGLPCKLSPCGQSNVPQCQAAVLSQHQSPCKNWHVSRDGKSAVQSSYWGFPLYELTTWVLPDRYFSGYCQHMLRETSVS